MISNVLFLNIQVKQIDDSLLHKKNNIILDLWFGLPGTLEALDNLARDFFDASSNKDENGQKTLLEKARELIKEFVDKKEQKRFESIFPGFS